MDARVHLGSLVKQPGGQASALREMIGSRPPFVLSASKSSRRVKRHKALVRNPPHPVAALRLGQSFQRKGLPAHDAGRRALRRFTAVISVEPSPTRSGRAFRSGLLAFSPGGPAVLPAHRS